MKTAGRPTLRCLAEDLHNDWDSADDQSDASRAPNCSKPLFDLDHPIIRKAADDFPAKASDSEVLRESISGLSNPVWWKVKIGARWRGAVWEDPDTGQAWLCAAGYRREREATDFYKSFMAAVSSGGAGQFLPTDDDRGRLATEIRVATLDEWSREVQGAVRGALQAVWAGGGEEEVCFCEPQSDDDRIACVTISVERESLDEEEVVDLVVSVECLDYSRLALVQWLELVALTAIDPREQRWGSLPVGGNSTHSQMLIDGEIDEVWERASAPTQPGTVELGDCSHYAHRHRLTERSVNGEGVKALCGAWFVPMQDHEPLTVCPHCAAIHRALPQD